MSVYDISGAGVITSQGINLPAPGGTRGTLDFYEEPVTITFSMSGPWASPRNLDFTFSRIGNIVYVDWDDLTSTSVTVLGQTIHSASTSGSQFIPSRFVPAIEVVNPCVVFDASDQTGITGDVQSSLGAFGHFFVFRSNSANTFTVSAGLAAGSTTWRV